MSEPGRARAQPRTRRASCSGGDFFLLGGRFEKGQQSVRSGVGVLPARSKLPLALGVGLIPTLLGCRRVEGDL